MAGRWRKNRISNRNLGLSSHTSSIHSCTAPRCDRALLFFLLYATYIAISTEILQQMSFKTNWHETYSELAEGLWKRYKEKGLATGAWLYQELVAAEKGLKQAEKQNRWLENFEKKYGVPSVDPIHIFSSLGGSSLREENRSARINIMLKVLGIEKSYETDEISFDGCPSPTIINLMNSRSEEVQAAIWEAFSDLMGEEGLKENTFTQTKDWYGVGVISFTIFMFWIASYKYISLDNNTADFLYKYKYKAWEGGRIKINA